MGAIINGIRLAFGALWHNPMRAALTVLGILIGVAAVISATSLGTGVRDLVTKQIDALGSNIMIIFPERQVASGARGAQGSGPRLTEDDGRAIAHEAVSVAGVCPNLRTSAQVVAGDENVSTFLFGTTRSYFQVRNWSVVRGDIWEEHDEVLKTKVAVLGATVATKLFGTGDPVGRYIRVGRHPFEVIGVLEAKGEGPFGDQDDLVLMPISSMRSRLSKTPPGFAGVLFASATRAETTERAVDQIDAILRQRHHIDPEGEPDFAIRTQKEFQQTRDRIFGVLTLILVLIAGISLVVGGIGIMNIMLVSVAERTREIGIRMAIGAQRHDIQSQFLVEALVLSIIGGIMGTLFGVAIVRIVSAAFDVPMSLSPGALLLANGAAAATGIGFGFFPARRASLLDPIEALRHE